MVLPPGVFITAIPMLLGGFNVDIVHADACPGNGLQPGVAFQHVGGDFHAAAADRPVGLQQGVAQASPFSPVWMSTSTASGGFQQVGCRPGRDRRAQ